MIGQVDLRGKRVAITGAASGIGRATAATLVDAGARVALLDIDEAALPEVARELGTRGGEVVWQVCDVTDADGCALAIRRAIDALGGLDLLINNAGITHRSLVTETDTAVLRRVMEVNYFGAVHCTQAALPALLRSRGCVVAVSSVAGFAPLVGRAGYAASKHALHGFFDTLRAEISADGVDVIIVCPSFADTAIEQRALGANGGHASRPRATVGRMVTAGEVAAGIRRAVERRRPRAVLTAVGQASWWISRIVPSLYAHLMRRSQAAAFGLARSSAGRR